MNITIRKTALAGAAFVALVASSIPASAAGPFFSIQIGTPPPPPPVIDRHYWAPPDPTAIWIDGHYEWVKHRWVWVAGYYTYPPRPGAYWVAPRYDHGSYYTGHWAWDRR